MGDRREKRLCRPVRNHINQCRVKDGIFCHRCRHQVAQIPRETIGKFIESSEIQRGSGTASVEVGR